MTDDRHRQARTLVRWISHRPHLESSVSSDTGGTSPALSGSLSSTCLFQSDPAQCQRRNSRTSVHPRRKGYLPKASSRVGAQTSLDVRTSTLVLPTARSLAARPEHVLVQTRSNAHVKPVGPGADSPTCHPGPVHSPRGVQSLKLSEDSDGEPSRHAPSP